MANLKQRPLPPDLRPKESESEELRAILAQLDQGEPLDGEHSPLYALLEGYAATTKQEVVRARAALNTPTLLASSDSFTHLVRGRLFFLLGDLNTSREALRISWKEATSVDWVQESAQALFELLVRIGDYRALQSLSVEVLASEVKASWLHEGFAAHALEMRDQKRCLAHLQVALEQAESTEDRFRLGLHRALVEGELAELDSLEPTDEKQRLSLAAAFDDLGAFKPATELYRQTGAMIEHARLTLWRGELEEAKATLESLVDDAKALRYLGAIALLDKDYTRSEELLRASIDKAPEAYETWIWLGELAMRKGEYESASQHLKRGSELVENAPDHFSFQCLRIILGIRSGQFVPRSIALSFEDVAAGVRLLIPEAPSIQDENSGDALSLLEDCMKLMGGNRSHRPTYVVQDKDERRLRTLKVPRSLRTRAKTTAWTLRYQSKKEVLQDFEAVMKMAPDSPLPHTYRGEVHLWSGDYVAAAADFQLGIDKPAETAIWAYIGMAATQLLQGEPDAALKTLDDGVEVSGVIGPTLYVYRGEARWLKGEHEAARKDLETAVSQRSERVGAWVVLGLVYGALEESDETLRVMGQLQRYAPALLSESARVLELQHWPPNGPVDVPTALKILNQARTLLRGNRASAMVTYFNGDDDCCFIPSQSPWDSNFVQGELLDIRVQLERSMGFRRTGYVLPAGAEKDLAALFLPARPGGPVGPGLLCSLRIEQDRVIAVVQEADGARVGLYFTHPELADEHALGLGALALTSVLGDPGEACDALVECLRSNKDKSLPWKETAPL
jgi:tetratricopeptide (TPR) repeat protein